MKTLLVLRHAKSDWAADYDADHDRPLNDRGVASARFMGELVAELGLVPDRIISSTAVRARTTAELALEAGEWASVLELDPDLYYSGAESVIRKVSEADDVERLMIVGHQPTWGSLVYTLTGVPAEIKTATLAVIEFDTTGWSEIATIPGDLVAVHHPPH